MQDKEVKEEKNVQEQKPEVKKEQKRPEEKKFEHKDHKPDDKKGFFKKKEDEEKKKLQAENDLLKAKIEALNSQKRTEELYAEALKAMRDYSGMGGNEDV